MMQFLGCVAARKPSGARAPLRIKPKAKGGGLGVKKMTTKVDDSLFDQAPAEAVIAPPPPVAMVSFLKPIKLHSTNRFRAVSLCTMGLAY